MGVMAGSERPLRALVLLEDRSTRAAIDRLLHRAGFGTVGVCGSITAVHRDLPRFHPDVVVVDLVLCGFGGIATLASLVGAAPQAAFLAVVPFEGLRQPALAAGVVGVAVPLDLRPLVDALDTVRATAHAGVICACCRDTPAAIPPMPSIGGEQ